MLISLICLCVFSVILFVISNHSKIDKRLYKEQSVEEIKNKELIKKTNELNNRNGYKLLEVNGEKYLIVKIYVNCIEIDIKNFYGNKNEVIIDLISKKIVACGTGVGFVDSYYKINDLDNRKIKVTFNGKELKTLIIDKNQNDLTKGWK
jgi:hypothetical protein